MRICLLVSGGLGELLGLMAPTAAVPEVNSAPSAKQQLTAIRMLFDWLVVGQAMP